MLTVRDLTIEIGAKGRGSGAGKRVVNGIGFDLAPGDCLGIVGESGSGKSMLALAIMGLLPPVARAAGSITLDGDELLAFDDALMDRVRGSRAGMIFQEPMTALNPAMTVGRQIAEGLRVRGAMTKSAARAEALRLMERVRLPDARRRLDLYPHEMSGGQRQRIVIAIAIALKPRLLIADEPTTALDVTVQKDILDLLDELSHEAGMAVLLISHDLGVIARMAGRTLVMHQGVCRESGRTADILRAPRDAYTRALISALPRRARASLDQNGAAADLAAGSSARHLPSETARGTPVVELRDIARHYRLPGGRLLKAVEGVSFVIGSGEVLGLVGESGSGKSTLARLVMALDRPTSGRILLGGDDLLALPSHELRRRRREFQMVFQDPYGSLDPRMSIARIVAEPLRLVSGRLGRPGRRARVAALLRLVGLEDDTLDRYPHEFSGGQRQRIAIARALITEPKLLVADEAVSALDLTLQAQILALLADLRARLGLSILFITHNLGVVDEIADRIAVMKDGYLVELGTKSEVLDAPRHAYTSRLLASEPTLSEIGRRGKA